MKDESMVHCDIQQRVIDMVRDKLAFSWDTGAPQTLENCLEQSREYRELAKEDQQGILISLIHSEIEFNRRSGHSPQLSEYTERFPNVERAILQDLISLPALPSLESRLAKKWTPARDSSISRST